MLSTGRLRIEILSSTFSRAITTFHNYSTNPNYKKCYRVLGLAEESDQEQIRKAYIELVKIYHPDSGTKEANAEKFTEIDAAFKTLIDKKSRERWDVPEEPHVHEQDIQHTAPQHRHYLSYDGIGSGSPFQRQKQYTKIRALRAADNLLNHRLNKASAEEGALLSKQPQIKHKIKTKLGYDRIVEDLIQESMSRGDFSKLSGSGKPLPTHQNTNPYVDFVTHKINEVLINNGFTPEWITLQKEIREEIEQFRAALLHERTHFGAAPLHETERSEWLGALYQHKETLKKINAKITKFNLVVPILTKQMVALNLDKEGGKILEKGKSRNEAIEKAREAPSNGAPSTSQPVNVFDFVDTLFRKK